MTSSVSEGTTSGGGGIVVPGAGELSNSTVHALRERFLSDPRGTDLSGLRPVIARSWLRSLACNVNAAGSLLQLFAPHADEQLLLAAEPVLSELERLCSDAGGSVVLTDAEGTVAVFRGDAAELRRAERLFPTVGGRMGEDLVGTNSDGTALEEGEAVQVWGPEHFNEALQTSYCTSVPVRDPVRRSIRGVLGVMLPEHVARSANAKSMLLLVTGAAAEITRRLAERLSAREQALMAEYMREVRKRGADAVVAMDDRMTIASRTALSVFDQSDFAVLAALAREAETTQNPLQRSVTVSAGREVTLQVRPMNFGDLGASAAAVVRVQWPSAAATVPLSAKRTTRSTPFEDFVGTTRGLRRALDAAATAASRRMPAYVVGEQGTGKLRLAEGVARLLAEQVEVVDLRATRQQLPSVDDLDRTLERGAAVVLHRVDRCSPEYRDELVALLSLLEQPQILVTSNAVTDHVLPIVSALRGIEITLPPLRERREDITALAEHFLRERGTSVTRLSAKLRSALVAADWPGNVHQLREVVASMSLDRPGEEARLADLSDVHLRSLATSPLTRLEEAELQQIRLALAEANGNRLRAARLLGIGRSTLYRKIESYEGRGFDLELG
ncbi:sigma-54-dependent Fis family transcriptional regulator [Kineococcus aurantiacus]|uniref:Transcriptional regulator of acetoin/glycerol metabolism n=1 Tax=Kineococcus aurantiacus TaxID=37633 RepID=A0A7Y9J3H6_9ACTN|nr:helix-turn-helix domain-containing protein [Kineococcus aurantiacus]NYD25130.1 transcriptional regulator of acetoin/glycerol metabolism [Kineococcus aurantiacus]